MVIKHDTRKIIRSGPIKKKLSMLLIIIFILLVLNSWEPKNCFNPDELFYFKSSQTLDKPGNIFAPKYYDEHRFQKPPLFYLMVFSSMKLFGNNWFSARLISALFGVLLMIMCFLLGRKMFGEETAFFGTAVLSTTVLFFRFGRIVLPEMALVSFMTGSLFCAYKAFHDSRRQYFYLSFLLMGAGTLVKGPAGFVLPVTVLIVFYLLNRKKYGLIRVPWIKGMLIVAAAVLLWVIPSLWLYGTDFFEHLLKVEILDRFSSEITMPGTAAVIKHHLFNLGFYIPVALAEFLPWSVLLPGLWFLTKKINSSDKHGYQHGFLVIWIIAGFLMYTAIPAKRAHYVLSFFPAMSLYLTSFLDTGTVKIKKAMGTLITGILAVYLIVVILVFPLAFIDGVDHISARLSRDLGGKYVPVIVSWRLDPQEVEFYLDRPVYVLNDREFYDWGASRAKLDKALSRESEKETLFYFLVAEEERDRYFNDLIMNLERYLGAKVEYRRVYTDSRWRKTIYFRRFINSVIHDPGGFISHSITCFREPVFLVSMEKR